MLLLCFFFIDPIFLQNLVAKEQGSAKNKCINEDNIESVTEMEDLTKENVDKNNAGKIHTLFLCNQYL